MDIDKGPSIPFFFTQLVFRIRMPRPLNHTGRSVLGHCHGLPTLSTSAPVHNVVGISLSHLFCDNLCLNGLFLKWRPVSRVWDT